MKFKRLNESGNFKIGDLLIYSDYEVQVGGIVISEIYDGEYYILYCPGKNDMKQNINSLTTKELNACKIINKNGADTTNGRNYKFQKFKGSFKEFMNQIYEDNGFVY